jgi:hypothetical protein
MNGCLETLHSDGFFGKILEEGPSLFGGPKEKCLAIQLPGPSLGGLCRQAQPLLARAQGLVGAFPSQRTSQQVCQPFQPFHQLLRPLAFLPSGIKAQDANRLAAHREREAQTRLDA